MASSTHVQGNMQFREADEDKTLSSIAKRKQNEQSEAEAHAVPYSEMLPFFLSCASFCGAVRRSSRCGPLVVICVEFD
jgi:hypothetical protein